MILGQIYNATATRNQSPLREGHFSNTVTPKETLSCRLGDIQYKVLFIISL